MTRQERLSASCASAIVLLVAALAFAAGNARAMTLASPSIANGRDIRRAQIYPRCGGANVSPALAWSGVPEQTKSFALTMIDLDVKPHQWSHWIVADIPRHVRALAAGAKSLPSGAHGVESNFGGMSYNGPCPPAGSGVHHYRFTLWALPVARLALAPNANADEITATLRGAALDSASLTGFVRR